MYFLEYIETSIAPFILIGLDIDFGNLDKLSLTFSNRFKLHDSVNTLKDMLETGYSAGRSLDTSKYIYGRTVAQATQVSKFMNDSLDVAKNAIVNAQNQSVRIDSAGIHVGGKDGRQLRMINNMIAMTDDNWQHAKLAIGLFGAEGARDSEGTTTNQYWGVNADVIGGKLIVGHNLIIENINDMGVMQFKVDATGAFLNNGTLCIQTDTQDKGKLMIDPRYGIAAGNQNLYTIGEDGISLLPSFIDGTGIRPDADEMPENAMFYLDIRNGKAYFRGDIHADNGYFRGTVYATDGEFNGIVKATDFQTQDGTSMLTKDGKFDAKWLDLMGINIKNDAGQTVMTIDQSGVKFGSTFSPIKTRYSTNKEATIPSGWSDTWNSSWNGTSTEVWAIYSYDSGVSWTTPMLAQGKTGAKGSDANVTRSNIEKALQKASTTSTSYIGVDSMGSPEIYGGAIYGTNIYAGDGSGSYAHMSGESLSLYCDGVAQPKVKIDTGWHGLEPCIWLGSGDGSDNQIFRIYKNVKQGIIRYDGLGNNASGFVFNEDGTVFPFLFTKMSGIWDFSNATVNGIHATFA